MEMGEAQPFATEGQQPFEWRCLRAEGRGPEQEGFLAGPLVLVEQNHHQPGPAAEATEQCALADARGRGDVVHRDGVRAALGDQPACGVEQQCPVARGVAPLLGCGYRQSADLIDAHISAL